MKTIGNAEISGGRKFFGAYSFRDLVVQDCEFRNANFGFNPKRGAQGGDRAERISVRRCRVSNCVVRNAEICNSEFSDIVGDMLICWGALFREVVLRGAIERLMLHGIPGGTASLAQKSLAKASRDEFYRRTDWALDISEARFEDFSIRTDAVPLRLLRLDKNSQFIFRRSDRDYSELATVGVSGYTYNTLRLLQEEGGSECLLVAPKLNQPLYDKVLRDVELLGRLGFY